MVELVDEQFRKLALDGPDDQKTLTQDDEKERKREYQTELCFSIHVPPPVPVDTTVLRSNSEPNRQGQLSTCVVFEKPTRYFAMVAVHNVHCG